MTSAPNVVAQEFSGRLFRAGVGAMELLSIEIGLKLGFWDALDVLGPTTSAELAAVRRTAERRTRQWLEQQAVCGYLAVEDVSAAAKERRYCLLPGLDSVLLDADDPVAMSGGLLEWLGWLLPPLLETFGPLRPHVADDDACPGVNEPDQEPLPCPGDERQRFRYLCSVLLHPVLVSGGHGPGNSR